MKLTKEIINSLSKEELLELLRLFSKEELIEYQKNFQHSFENPAEHDPKFVAWKKACEVKKCFPKDEPTQGFKGIQKEPGFPSKMIY